MIELRPSVHRREDRLQCRASCGHQEQELGQTEKCNAACEQETAGQEQDHGCHYPSEWLKPLEQNLQIVKSFVGVLGVSVRGSQASARDDSVGCRQSTYYSE